jgi:hypothetical protein
VGVDRYGTCVCFRTPTSCTSMASQCYHPGTAQCNTATCNITHMYYIHAAFLYKNILFFSVYSYRSYASLLCSVLFVCASVTVTATVVCVFCLRYANMDRSRIFSEEMWVGELSSSLCTSHALTAHGWPSAVLGDQSTTHQHITSHHNT